MISYSGRLRLKRASDYKYLNQSDCLEIHNIDDAQKFHNFTVFNSFLISFYVLYTKYAITK